MSMTCVLEYFCITCVDGLRYCSPDKWQRYCICIMATPSPVRLQVTTAMHQSLSLSYNTSCKDDTKSQGWNSVSIPPEVVNSICK